MWLQQKIKDKMESIIIVMVMLVIFGAVMVGIALYSDHKKKAGERL